MAKAVSRDFFSMFLFCLLLQSQSIFSQLKTKHCNINIEVSFSCPTVVKFYIGTGLGYQTFFKKNINMEQSQCPDYKVRLKANATEF